MRDQRHADEQVAAAREAAARPAPVAPGPEAPAPGPEAVKPELVEVEHDLEELLAAKQRSDEYLALAQRTQADFENYRKRVARDAAQAEARGKAGILKELLPVLDNLERALAAAEPRIPDQGEDHLAEGVRLVLEEVRGTLARNGVEALAPTGERFDPEWHEAISMQPAAAGTAPGTVVEVMAKGYTVDGALLRPARVVVSQ